ncbi:uroporphyrinogen-III synthase [Wolbachia endosymbiont of Howardula sp.]|uniref:uroporphyrinogen-III synthase n=1 Tax=Wolbachia endosymbiont of Howardula sp. TaxID=2916816 RepID=UPI00217E01C8|nr:uroporphyrinogen-III synthase [Wolbachia endosymbiont of Howardula sp.]UWI83291.1 uroporphyrinogen-III synthase [Wolbachia endosymbiont of Howardula sp.]
MSKSILLTRPMLDSLKTSRLLRKSGHKVLIEPLFALEYLNVDISLYDFDIILATSQHSIKALSQIYRSRHIPIITVGNATMQTAKNLGFFNITSANSNVEGLITLIQSHYFIGKKFLYIRGHDITCELQKILSEKDFFIREVLLYKTLIKNDFSFRCQHWLLDKQINSVIFFSSQTANIFCTLAAKSGLSHIMSDITAFTMSTNISERLKSIRWKKIITSITPSQEGIIEVINKN